MTWTSLAPWALIGVLVGYYAAARVRRQLAPARSRPRTWLEWRLRLALKVVGGDAIVMRIWRKPGDETVIVTSRYRVPPHFESAARTTHEECAVRVSEAEGGLANVRKVLASLGRP